MSTYEIAIYLTRELRDHAADTFSEPYRAQQRAATYLRGAFAPTPHDVRLILPSDVAPAPQESVEPAFEADCPCDPGTTCSFHNLLRWFRDWVTCGEGPVAADANVLLSATPRPNGGRGFRGGRFSVATTGRFVSRLPASYRRYGFSDAHDGMHTVLHELGHNLMAAGPFDDDGDGEDHHDVGEVHTHLLLKAVTPMGVAGDEGHCGQTGSASGVGGHELRWSSCCVDRWTEPRQPDETGESI